MENLFVCYTAVEGDKAFLNPKEQNNYYYYYYYYYYYIITTLFENYFYINT